MSQTWFITGTSSGLGRELTHALLQRGDRVVATLRNPRVLRDLNARFPRQVWVRELDVTNTSQLREVVDAAFAELGQIDVVVSNAGFALAGMAEELADGQIQRQIDTNLLAPIQLARAAIPHLRSQGGGRILQVSSMGGHVAYPGLSLYHATKWGIEGFFEALRGELESFNIFTTLIEPGVIPTGLFAAADVAGASDVYTSVQRPFAADGGRQHDIAGDLSKTAEAMIEIGRMDFPPPRQLLGSDAYHIVRAALRKRLLVIAAGRELALSTNLVPPAL